MEQSAGSSAPTALPWSYIAQSFVSAYYHALATAADTLYNFYDEQASAVRTVLSVEDGSDKSEEPEWSSTEPLTGQMAIHQVSQQIGECRVQVGNVSPSDVPFCRQRPLIRPTDRLFHTLLLSLTG